MATLPAQPYRPGWRRQICFRLLALTLSTLVALLLSEIVVRAFVGSPLAKRLPAMIVQAHPERGWQMVPSSLHYDYCYPVEVNSLGLPDRELGPKTAGELRILALGDSFVYGQGVPAESSLPVCLERQLNKTYEGQTFRVVNSGHPGYATEQELALLRELGPTIDADVVILFWFHNDLAHADVTKIHDDLSTTGEAEFGITEPLTGGRLVKWHAIQLLRRSAAIMFLHDALAIATAKPLDEAAIAAGRDRLAEHLKQLAAMSLAENFRVVVVIIPDPNALVSEHWSVELGDQVAALCRSHGFDAIQLLDVARQLCREQGGMPIVPFDGHYNERANQAFAEALAEQLVLQQKDASHPDRSD